MEFYEAKERLACLQKLPTPPLLSSWCFAMLVFQVDHRCLHCGVSDRKDNTCVVPVGGLIAAVRLIN